MVETTGTECRVRTDLWAGVHHEGGRKRGKVGGAGRQAERFLADGYYFGGNRRAGPKNRQGAR